jgi:hypothetical protein
MQVGAAGIALIFGSFLALFWYRERKSYRATGTSAPLGLGVVGPRNGAVTPMETRT